MYTHLIIHYGELAIKGNNRPWFERVLIDNIKQALKQEKYEKIKKISGRFILELAKDSNREAIQQALQSVFGIAYFSPAIASKQDIESIKKEVSRLVKDEQAKSIRVLTKRSNKNFPLSSIDVNKIIGQHLIENHHFIVDLIDADLSIWIEIVEHYIFVYKQKIEGPKGLPLGTSGRVLSMISGGIDSPVASYLMMKRGCRLIFVHFHSHPYTKEASIKKTKKLVSLLAKYQGQAKLYLIPFIDIQKEIMALTEKKNRVIHYRRFMVKIAEIIAQQEKAAAIVTGENLAQVASQTLENMHAIQEVCTIPILRPLLTYEKQEIVDLAKKIGTYETSIEPHEDCCSLFVPKHPTTNANVKKIQSDEEKITKQKQLMENALEHAEIVKF